MSDVDHYGGEYMERSNRERSDIVARYDKGREEGAHIDPWEDPKFEVYHITDRYGFLHDHGLPSIPEEHKQKQVEIERVKKWLKMTKNWEKYFPSEKILRRIYKGIPDKMRAIVWSLLLNLENVKQEQEGRYMSMRDLARKWSPDIKQIDLDVNRTYRNHIMFRERYGTKQQALFHVLAAYSMYNTEVGYCQGMSQVAALLLMYLNEEDAFWALSVLLSNQKHAMHGFYIPGFPKLIRFQDHHDNILKKLLPKVKKHLDKFDVRADLYCLKWFFQCFLDRVPFSLTIRLWDIYMLEGERLLVAMAYNLLKIHQKTVIKQKTMEDIVHFLQVQLEQDFHLDNNTAIELLQTCMEELRKYKLDLPPPGKVNEFPQKPFGMPVKSSLDRQIHRRSFLNTNAKIQQYSVHLQPGGVSVLLQRDLDSNYDKHIQDSKLSLGERESKYSLDPSGSEISSFAGHSSRNSYGETSHTSNASTTHISNSETLSCQGHNSDLSDGEVTISTENLVDRHRVNSFYDNVDDHYAGSVDRALDRAASHTPTSDLSDQYPRQSPDQYQQKNPDQYAQKNPDQYPRQSPNQYPQQIPDQHPQQSSDQYQYQQHNHGQYQQYNHDQYQQHNHDQYRQLNHDQYKQLNHDQYKQLNHDQYQQLSTDQNSITKEYVYELRSNKTVTKYEYNMQNSNKTPHRPVNGGTMTPTFI